MGGCALLFLARKSARTVLGPPIRPSTFLSGRHRRSGPPRTPPASGEPGTGTLVSPRSIDSPAGTSRTGRTAPDRAGDAPLAWQQEPGGRAPVDPPPAPFPQTQGTGTGSGGGVRNASRTGTCLRE